MFARNNAFVLPKRIVDRVQGQEVVTTVDLDDEADIVPAGVEVDASSPSCAHRLSGWSRQADTATHPREVEFTQRLRTTAHVANDRIEKPFTWRPLDALPSQQ